eukprot:g20036.t1
MLSPRTGFSRPQSIEQARQDFKIYMSKLLEHSAALQDALRPDARYTDVGDAGSGGPAWGPSPKEPSEVGASVEDTRGSPAAGATLHAPSTSLSPSYFREEHAWPRAGAVTPPRPRPPLNFSWVAEPPTPRGGVHGGGGGATGRSLFLDSAPSLAPPPEGGRRPSDQHGTARGRLEGENGGFGDEWKAQWSKRLVRGPVHSEYQARFPWPPRSALKTTSAVYATSTSAANTAETRAERSAMTTSPVPRARSVSPLRRRGRDRGRADGGSSSDARKEEGKEKRGPRGTSEPPGGRVDSLTEMPRNELRPSPSANVALQHDVEHVNGNKAVPVGISSVGEDQRVGKDEAPQMEDALVDPPPTSKEIGSGTRCSVSEGREWASGRDDVGGLTDLVSRAVATDGSPVAEANVTEQAWDSGGREAWREQAVGRGETTLTSGRQTLDHSYQSIVTEYMDEFGWPSTLPVPGRRGKRTGMGVDHVGRLLAGKRAQEPRKVLDPGIVAKLGAAADGALRAVRPRHLSEMCRLRSPSPACRRLVLGLVSALGLRWRRWSDIRSRLLGNTSELVGFLKKFDKNRSGLTSATLRPFVEDPSLAPAHVRRVSACMIWVSRWLRALHNYLAAKEGNLSIDMDIGTASLLRTPSAAALPGRASRRLYQTNHGRVHGTPSGLASGSTVEKEVGKCPPSAAKQAPTTQVERRDTATNDGNSRDTATKRHPSHAAATRGDGSSRAPLSTVSGCDVDGGSSMQAGRGGIEGEGRAAGVNFTGSSGGGLDSESQWTAGTVTSRGDVLGAHTYDQVDIGSGVEAGHGEENTQPVRHRYDDGAGALSSLRAPASVGGGAAARVLKGVRGSSRRELSRGAQASHGCIYRHKHKARTPSRIANPKARRPTRTRADPILANVRWPPPVEVRDCDRTEQRSAFSIEHSFLAYE